MNHKILIIISEKYLKLSEICNPDKIHRNPDITADITTDFRFYPDKIRINRNRIEALSHTTFDKGDRSRTDVQTYFGQTYNKRLYYAHLPCIIVRENTYLPMEVCDVIEVNII